MQKKSRWKETLSRRWKGFLNINGVGLVKSELLIAVDPFVEGKKLIYGRNQPRGGVVVPIMVRVQDLTEKLNDKVDLLLMISPDPRNASEMTIKSDRLVKPSGKIVTIFEDRSQYRHLNSQAIAEILSYYKYPESDFLSPQLISYPEKEFINSLIGGSVNSEFPLNDSTVLILTRKK